MDRSHTPGVIQGDVELRNISASPSVELSHLLTPSLPDDKLQAEMSLDFDGSCSAHDSVLGSSFPLGRETDVSMGDDECLDLSVTPSFETGLSDYAPTCFDSGTITHSIHTHPVCAVSESVSSFIGKDQNSDRNQQDSVVAAQILNASPFILGSTSAANFVHAVLENLQSRNCGVLQAVPSIISVAPGIFVLNTLGTPGIIDLPLRTSLPSNDPSVGVSSAFQTAITLAHSNLEEQQPQDRNSEKINPFIPSNFIKLEIRTIPFGDQFPLVTSNNSSMVLQSNTNTNLPISLTSDTFCENIPASTYSAFDGIQAESLEQLEDRDLTYCPKEKECDINKICSQTDHCSDNVVEDEKPSQTSTSVDDDGKFDNMILESVMQDGMTESACHDLSASSLINSVDNSLWSQVDQFCTFSSKSQSESTSNIQENISQSGSSKLCSAKHVEVQMSEKSKLVETILYSNNFEIIPDDSAVVNTSFKENNLASVVEYVGNKHNETTDTTSSKVICSEIGTLANKDDSVSTLVTMASGPTEETEDDSLSEQLSWGECNNGEVLQPAARLPAHSTDNCDNTENLSKPVVVLENKDCELKIDTSKPDLPTLDSSAHPLTSVVEDSADKAKCDSSAGEGCVAVQNIQEISGTSKTSPAKPEAADDTSDLKISTLESGGQDDRSDQTDLELSGQDGEHSAEASVSECELCNATFTRPGNYKRHLKLHDFKHWNNNRYKCENCGRSFLQHCDLKRHMLIHENREPYKCSVCGKGYIRKSDLVVHLRFHNKEKVFKCDQCSKSYYQNGDLKRHMRTHTRQELLICAYCGRKLAKQTTLLQHMQSRHKEIIIETFQSVEKHRQLGEDAT